MRTAAALVRIPQDPTVFTARGYSTFRNDKGEAVDCLPGAENSDWAALVAQTKKQEAAAAVAAAAAAATAGQGTAPAAVPVNRQRPQVPGPRVSCR